MTASLDPIPPVVLCDLDGVVWLAGEPLPGVADAVARLRRAGLVVAFLTNNSSLPVAEYVARLERIGIPTEQCHVLTSALAAAAMLAGDLPSGARVLACAGAGVDEALEARGLRPPPWAGRSRSSSPRRARPRANQRPTAMRWLGPAWRRWRTR